MLEQDLKKYRQLLHDFDGLEENFDDEEYRKLLNKFEEFKKDYVEEEYSRLRAKYDKVYRTYLEKFGKDSLEYVFLWDPMSHLNYWYSDLLGAIVKLSEAIETNLPLDNAKPEIHVIY